MGHKLMDTSGHYMGLADLGDGLTLGVGMTSDYSYVLRTAMMTHEVNRAWCALNGDNSQKPWNEAPEWQKASAIDGVRFILDNPTAGDAASHDNWTRVKLAEGWRYGPRKDEAYKTHPCLVPFDKLPWDQQAKDTLFRAIVLGLAKYAPARTS